MKPNYILPLALAVAVVGTSATADFKRITTEAEYVQAFVGKTLIDENGHRYTISADGKFSDKLKDGTKVRGAWQWSRKFWCRNAVVGDREIGTDCQTIEVDGNKYRFTRKKGKGQVGTGTIN